MPKAVATATAEYRSEMDIIGAFINACCIDNPNGMEQAKDLFAAYAAWAKENNEFEMTATRFGREMSKRFEKKHTRGGWFYFGISLTDESRPYQVNFKSV